MGGTRAVHVWVLVLLGLQLLMAIAAIGVFVRMAPAIERIIERNLRSLEESERMLIALARVDQAQERRIATFADALVRARQNITELGESDVLDRIEGSYRAALAGETAARSELVEAIDRLSGINHEAMERADQRARQLGEAGAWGVVFMGLALFAAGLLILRSLRRHVVAPLEEIHAVLLAHQRGDVHRRCKGPGLPRDVQRVFGEINELLDLHAVPGPTRE